MKNIVLTGMPGCGKSTAGVLLAKIMGYPFIDTDLIIQQKEGKLLQNMINQDGIEAFLQIEERIVSELNVTKHVIATGGSVVYSQKSMENLKKCGLIVYLQLEYKEVEARIKNMKSRGIAIAKDQSLMDLYAERIPLYEKYSDITIRCSGMNLEETVSLINERILDQK